MSAAPRKLIFKKATSANRVKSKNGNRRKAIKFLPKLQKNENRGTTKLSNKESSYSATTLDEDSHSNKKVDPAAFEARILDLKLY